MAPPSGPNNIPNPMMFGNPFLAQLFQGLGGNGRFYMPGGAPGNMPLPPQAPNAMLPLLLNTLLSRGLPSEFNPYPQQSGGQQTQPVASAPETPLRPGFPPGFGNPLTGRGAMPGGFGGSMRELM